MGKRRKNRSGQRSVKKRAIDKVWMCIQWSLSCMTARLQVLLQGMQSDAYDPIKGMIGREGMQLIRRPNNYFSIINSLRNSQYTS